LKMMLRNPTEEYYGYSSENVFLGVDERTGETMGSCFIDYRDCDVMFPDRPVQVRLVLQGDYEAMDTLMGAALGRARMLCAAKNADARIYVDCDADDEEMMDLIKQYGFKDNDFLVRMVRSLPLPERYKAPAGCVLVRDELEDPTEQKLFLDRWNNVFGVHNDQEWLGSFRDHENFTRVLLIAPSGIVGEAVVWSEGNTGVIAFAHTTYRWQNMGVAKYLITTACRELASQGVKRVVADFRSSTPHMQSIMKDMGFEQTRVLRRYPGIDINRT